MPSADFYSNLSLSEKLLLFANWHHQQDQRHISSAEHEFLLEAAAVLEGMQTAFRTLAQHQVPTS